HAVRRSLWGRTLQSNHGGRALQHRVALRAALAFPVQPGRSHTGSRSGCRAFVLQCELSSRLSVVEEKLLPGTSGGPGPCSTKFAPRGQVPSPNILLSAIKLYRRIAAANY